MKKNEKILTISVAAYNLGDMIKKNLDSFVKLKQKDLVEVIVTNDGSTDNTKAIIENYVNKYPNIIKLIDKKNEGAGSTVNSGIKNATGKYFKMVDGDDWVNTENLDLLIEKLKTIDCDMILNNFDVFSNYKNKIIESVSIPTLKSDTIYNITEIPSQLSLKMHSITYKTSILKDNNILLDNGFYTDQEFVLFPLKFVNSVIYYDISIYVYMVGREGQSISIDSLKKHVDMHDLVLKHLMEFYVNSKKCNAASIMKKRILNMSITHLNILLSLKMDKKNINNIKKFCNYLKKNDIDIYNSFKNTKKASIIINSNYHLLKPLSILYKMKLKLN